ncbi:uncharacterized protein [Primulina huaijiensis]|uniref:uncharacterized protein n=1 Tax=Primulina huaijiensis TaxID=1492673 RepID=UPI003CC75A2F
MNVFLNVQMTHDCRVFIRSKFFTLIIKQSLHHSMDTNPFGNLGVDQSQSELRETAYEILVAACRSSGGEGLLLTFPTPRDRRPLQRTSSVDSISAASKVKKALGLKSKKKNDKKDLDGSENLNRAESVRRRSGNSVSELVRVQMRVTEQNDSRVRRGLLRVAAGQIQEIAPLKAGSEI